MSVREFMEHRRPLEVEATPVFQLGREAIDWVLHAPASFMPWRASSILPEDAFRFLPERERTPNGSVADSLSMGLDTILGESLQSLSDLIVHSKWSVVRPSESEESPIAGKSAALQARMSIPLGDELPIEARLGLETDGVREDYFVISTELGSVQNPMEARWLAWSTRLDYRTSLESPASARAEQRVGLRLGGNDAIGVSGRLEDRNLDVGTSPLLDLAPAGEAYWTHQWLTGIESSFKVRQSLPDLQSLWLTGSGGNVQLEAALRSSLNSATRMDLQGTTTPDLTQYGLRLQLEYLLGVPAPPVPQRLMSPESPATESRTDF